MGIIADRLSVIKPSATVALNAKAMEMYGTVLESGGEPDMVRAASINMAELLRTDGRDEEALAIYSDYADVNPDDVLGLLNYAVALMAAGVLFLAAIPLEAVLGYALIPFGAVVAFSKKEVWRCPRCSSITDKVAATQRSLSGRR